MGKKINAYIDANTNRIIILSDDVQKDDYIDLNSLSSINEYIELSVDKNEKLKSKFINNFKNSEEYLKLRKESENLKIANIEINKLKDDLKKNEENVINKFKTSDEFNNLKNENFRLLQDINLLKKQIETNKQNIINEFIASDEYQQKLSELTNIKSNYEHLKNDLPNIKNNAIQEYKNSFEYKKLEAQLDDYKKQIDLRNTLNVKQVGEDLEKYCFDLYNETMGQFVNDCKFEKTNIAIHNNKPDFLFEVYGKDINNNVIFEDEYLLGKVILEMKSELLNSDEKNKKTNEYHLSKLETNRKNFNADLAILVTELEADKDFVIKKPTNYQNIVIIRPQALPSLLNILRNLFLKKNELIVEQINFKSSKEIIDEFNNFKDEILNKIIFKMNSKVENIIKCANNIIKNADSILEDANKILNDFLTKATKKIEGFKIEKKITNKIEKIDYNTYHQNKIVTNTIIVDEENIINEKIKK